MNDISQDAVFELEQNRTAARVSSAERFQGAAMAVVLAAGFAMGVAALVSPTAQRQLADASSLPALLAGRTAGVVNHAMAHYLPVDLAFREAGGILRWRLFASGGPQVWAGRQGWLYLMEELRPWSDAEAIMQTRVDIVGRVASSLHEKGIDLLVVLVPDKARVVTGTMDGPRSAQADARYPALLAMLQQRGLRVVNLADAFAAAPHDTPLFYRTDTHWNQTGAALAARTTAAAVTTEIDRSHHFRTTADAAETDAPGDLLRLMSLDQVPDGLLIPLRPPIDRQHLEHTAEVDAPAEGGLLDSGPSIDVALVGSSFSVNANFAGHLQEALGAPVGNFGKMGGAFAGSAKSYLASPAFRETPPKLVIWEMPERVMGQPMTDDDHALEAAFPRVP